ncbi:MAG: sulfatase-like hydrolase/transferase [Alistipes indistinctus]
MTLERWGLSERYHETSKDFTFHAVKNRQAPGREIYVLVIGEASRADSWSLFGYDRETTPGWEKREGVVPFSNVLTQSNATHRAYRSSCHPLRQPITIRSMCKKSLITAFKEAGFQTWYLSRPGTEPFADRLLLRRGRTPHRYFSARRGTVYR